MLEELEEKFNASFSNKEMEEAIPYSLNSTFWKEIKGLMVRINSFLLWFLWYCDTDLKDEYNNHPERKKDKIAQTYAKLESVTANIMENLGKNKYIYSSS